MFKWKKLSLMFAKMIDMSIKWNKEGGSIWKEGNSVNWE